MVIDFGTMIAQLIFFIIIFVIIVVIFYVCYRKFGKKSNTQQRIEQLENEVRELKNILDKYTNHNDNV